MGLDIYFLSDDKNDIQDDINEKTQVGYFRKINSLFNWVNINVQSIENCTTILISKDVLIKLSSILDELTPDNCHKLFPTCDGFFFGSAEYDKYYWFDVEEVKNWLKGILNSFDFENKNLYFWAWW
ncbi:hypothetical protein KKJ09_04580 [Xenorhabdus bovienii]|uniref:hypothetical protein n=2 Tax=Xenorhabdus bovienii TaxID=40576 RepID=UPI0023B24362|nr:hypothetical protein [Xenorhabdus bovienii]MDE9492890.1 hypothetical protein [Xenorhabdus bovienii]MDE9501328.1 hypothetical protein [Xenorhabdus bovienii]MDE9525054.1 hypothetical protein [Xenorhabdus bovienii]MDE9568958.1 hypothetical protein [Xenorhabdus bovienii]